MPGPPMLSDLLVYLFGAVLLAGVIWVAYKLLVKGSKTG